MVSLYNNLLIKYMSKPSIFLSFNWKMNPVSDAHTLELLSVYKKHKKPHHNIAVFPPAIFLSNFRDGDIPVGGQDISIHDSGSHTGQISGDQLKNSGCEYVLVGHSELRELQKINSGGIHKKVHQAWKAGLEPILCVSIYNPKGIYNQLKEQIEAVFHNKNVLDGKIKILFEPLTALQTGVAMSVKQIEHYLGFIKIILSEKGYSDIPLFYGGGVNSSNIVELMGVKNLSGLIIGNASVKADEVEKILNLV
jgi:triosephosphate isomerase (TIM)